MKKRRIFFIAGGAGLLVLALALGAFLGGPLLASANSHPQAASSTPTATTGSTYCQQFEQNLANRLNVSVSTLQQDRQAALKDVLAQAVKDGKLTQAQADKITQRLQQQQGQGCDLFHGGQGSQARQLLGKYLPGAESELAQGLHLTVDQLKADLMSGKSLQDIATAQHLTAAQLQTLVTTTIKDTLNKAVSAGDLTQAQATMITQKLQGQPQFLERLLGMHFGKHT